MEKILYKGLLNADRNDDSLGDRREYVGASDIAGCPRKIILQKLELPKPSLTTLLRFSRGHLAESVVKRALENCDTSPWEYQKELVHSKYPFKAHLDFLFEFKSVLGVLEVKTVSGIPNVPYEGWIRQLHFQMGLLEENKTSAKEVKGAILALDLDRGDCEYFKGFSYDKEAYSRCIQRASYIWVAMQDGNLNDLKTEKGPLCAWCPYRPNCPAYDIDESVPEMPLQEQLQQYLGLKQTQKDLKAEIDKLAVLLKAGIENGNPDGDRIKVGQNLVRRNVRHSTRFNSAALKKDLPEVYAKYAAKTSYEVLVIE